MRLQKVARSRLWRESTAPRLFFLVNTHARRFEKGPRSRLSREHPAPWPSIFIGRFRRPPRASTPSLQVVDLGNNWREPAKRFNLRWPCQPSRAHDRKKRSRRPSRAKVGRRATSRILAGAATKKWAPGSNPAFRTILRHEVRRPRIAFWFYYWRRRTGVPWAATRQRQPKQPRPSRTPPQKKIPLLFFFPEKMKRFPP